MAGAGGIVATSLTAPMTNSANTMSVASTAGFLSSDVLVVDNEYIAYSGTTAVSFTGLTRGYNNSTPTSHTTGKYVYGQEMNLINEALGFNIGTTTATSGTFAVVSMGFTFLARTLINLVIWDFPNIFQGQLVILRIAFIAVGVGLVIYLVLEYLFPALGLTTSAR